MLNHCFKPDLVCQLYVKFLKNFKRITEINYVIRKRHANKCQLYLNKTAEKYVNKTTSLLLN